MTTGSINSSNQSEPPLLSSLDEGVLTLTLNQPAKRNAMSETMLQLLADQLLRADADAQIRCVVITGAGSGFCSGGDLSGMSDDGSFHGSATLEEAINKQKKIQAATTGQIYKLSKPTIASVNGSAVGAGLSLALACDFRIMSARAKLVTGFASVGAPGDFGCSFFLSNLVGLAKATELLMLSDPVGAQTALELGLINELCEPDDIAMATNKWASRLSNGPTIAYQYMKANLRSIQLNMLDACLEQEATHHNLCSLTEDHKNAVRAFMKKEPPTFLGR